jgi:arylsulfatase A-like enzyme
MTRRQCLGALAAGTVALGSGLSLWAESGRRPNVVLMLCDDLGAGDLGCYGASDLSTPHLDRLAADGVRFTQFYAGAPVCSASRAGLLTGRYFQRALDRIKGLRGSETTMAEMFRAAGYRTALYGKWHLAGDPPSPNAHGFEDFLGHRVGAIDSYSHFTYWDSSPQHALWRNGERYHEDGAFLPDIVARESCRFIESHRDEPFLLFVAFNQPHYPMQPEPSFRAQHHHIDDWNRRLYAANVASLDDKVGRILDCLQAQGLAEDTIVLFMSDHGHSDEPGGRGGSAGGLRGAKGSLFEGGIRVPCLARWPGSIAAGEIRNQPAQMMDWLPTLAACCGVDAGDVHLDGGDLGRVLAADGPAPRASLHWMLGSQFWAVRQGQWKLLTLRSERFLVDLKTDPGETTSVAAENESRVQHLQRLHAD